MTKEHRARVEDSERISAKSSDAAKARSAEIDASPDNAIPPEYIAIYTANRDTEIVNKYRIKYQEFQKNSGHKLKLVSNKIHVGELSVKLLGKSNEELKKASEEYNQLLESRHALVKGVIDELQQSVKVLAADSKTGLPESPRMPTPVYDDSKDAV